MSTHTEQPATFPWPEMHLIHRWPVKPWCEQREELDGDLRPHLVPYDPAASVAYGIALDIIQHRRWGAGPEGEPVYDFATGRYRGLHSDPRVASTMTGHEGVVRIPRGYRPTPDGEPGHRHDLDHLTETVYRQMLPGARRYLALYCQIRAYVQAGTVDADEPVIAAATRMYRRGYRVADLIREIEGREPTAAETLIGA